MDGLYFGQLNGWSLFRTVEWMVFMMVKDCVSIYLVSLFLVARIGGILFTFSSTLYAFVYVPLVYTSHLCICPTRV